MTDIETVLARVRSKASGRTRYEGQEPYDDEIMLAEIERLHVENDRLSDKAIIGEYMWTPAELAEAQREARKAAIEECAAICDSRMYDFGCIAGAESADFVIVCADLAAAIRALAEDANA